MARKDIKEVMTQKRNKVCGEVSRRPYSRTKMKNVLQQKSVCGSRKKLFYCALDMKLYSITAVS